MYVPVLSHGGFLKRPFVGAWSAEIPPTSRVLLVTNIPITSLLRAVAFIRVGTQIAPCGGDASHDVSRVLDVVWGGPETVVLISSDLSHYLSYAHARKADKATTEEILALHGPLHHEQACGGTPLSGLLESARLRNMRTELLDLRNSGDTSGDRSRVVGYAAVAFYEPVGEAP